jgi:3-oxoacyl-[acyl-carrier-protein] synthase II
MTAADAVWITGVGTANPLGTDFAATADNLLAGRSGVAPITGLPVENHPCRIAARVSSIPVPPGWTAAGFAKLERLNQLVLWCCAAALRDAGHWDRRAGLRVGMILGLGAEGLRNWELDSYARGGKLREPAEDGPEVLRIVRGQLGLAGPATVVAAACASGNVALAQARQWLRRGWVDIALAGGCDLWVTPMALAGFGNLRVLSKRNDQPTAACRPFDRDRDGFVMGEGGAMFVLEPATTARRRSAKPYAELAGCGSTGDASHLVIPSPDPTPAARAVRLALADAGVRPDEVDYINAHGTGTVVGDRAEAAIIREVFGSATATIPASSTKSMTGHLLSAAAAVEALACLAAIDRQAVPPTINLDHPDPACDLCHVPHTAQERRVRVAVSNSFGFGGSNNCVVLRRAG